MYVRFFLALCLNYSTNVSKDFLLLLCAMVLSSFVGYLILYKIYCVLLVEFLCRLGLNFDNYENNGKKSWEIKTNKMLRQSVAVKNPLSRFHSVS